MKNKKIEIEIENENSNEECLDKETKAMKNKFKSLNSLTQFLEGIMLVPIGIFIILTILSFLSSITDEKTSFLDSLFSTITAHEEGTPVTTEDLIELTNAISGDDKMTKEEYSNQLEVLGKKNSEKILISFLIIKFVLAVIDYVIVIFIVDNIGKIFLSIQKDGTPFTDNNVKCLNRIDIFAIILWIFGIGRFSIGFISIIIISAITYVFKYGCKLQKEVDEIV